MDAKFRVKLGPAEIEYEGESAFLKEELPSLLGDVMKLYKESALPPIAQNVPPHDAEGSKPPALLRDTTASIASKLACKSGPELALAAAAYCTIVAGMPSFTRDQILREMKSATHHYKKSYSNNLSSSLDSLVSSDKFRPLGNDTYSLSEATKGELEARLAH